MLSEEEIMKNLEQGILIDPEEDTLSDVESQEKNNDNSEDTKKEKTHDIIFLKKYIDIFKKRNYNDFFKHFIIRYKNTESLLKTRQELKGLVSISRLKLKSERETVSIIAMIKDKQETKKGNLILTVEDLTGTYSVLVTQKNKQLYEFAKNTVFDEVLGFTGTLGKGIIFSQSIICPDIPLTHELKKHPDEIYAAFIGDPHIGSNVFLEEEFSKMVKWLNGEIGSEKHRQIAKKIKYIFMVGDLVEGVGIYPGQENDLKPEFHDIKEQYTAIMKLLQKIRKDITIVISPGNHDYGRIAEPQLPLTNEYSKSISNMENVVLVSNPAFLNFGKTEDFPGFNILLYHGGSLIYFSENVPKIRNAGGQKAVDQTMKFLLQRRHLAPTHKSTLYIPDPEKDFLFIDIIPDFFVTGHIHRANIGSYRNITLISSSCWTGKTEDQVKRGLEPQPAKLPIVNLKTREVKLVNFLSKEHEGVMER